MHSSVIADYCAAATSLRSDDEEEEEEEEEDGEEGEGSLRICTRVPTKKDQITFRFQETKSLSLFTSSRPPRHAYERFILRSDGWLRLLRSNKQYKLQHRRKP